MGPTLERERNLGKSADPFRNSAGATIAFGFPPGPPLLSSRFARMRVLLAKLEKNGTLDD